MSTQNPIQPRSPQGSALPASFGLRLPKFVVNWLLGVHSGASAQPYFDLDGYMIRHWILGGASRSRNDPRPPDAQPWTTPPGGRLYEALTRRLAIRAHTILRSDSGRDLHDHPCASLSVVLEGGYWEVLALSMQRVPFHGDSTLTTSAREQLQDELAQLAAQDINADHVRNAADLGIFWRGPGAVVWRRARTWHRLILPVGTQTKSIFCLGPKTQGWGFLTGCGKVPAGMYLARLDGMQKADLQSLQAVQPVHSLKASP